MLALDKAIELVSKLDRTINYPKEYPGIVGLATGLKKASDLLKVGAGLIVDRCAETSQFCPTDADLMQIARDIARCDAVAAGKYDTTASDANSGSIHRAPCAQCQNSGWEIIYTLHTLNGGGWKRAKRENITREQFDNLSEKLDPKTQRVFSGARRCDSCRPGGEVEDAS